MAHHAAIRQGRLHYDGRTSRDIVMQREPTDFLPKLQPHCWKSISLNFLVPVSRIYRFAYFPSGTHIFLLAYTFSFWHTYFPFGTHIWASVILFSTSCYVVFVFMSYWNTGLVSSNDAVEKSGLVWRVWMKTSQVVALCFFYSSVGLCGTNFAQIFLLLKSS